MREDTSALSKLCHFAFKRSMTNTGSKIQQNKISLDHIFGVDLARNTKVPV